MERACGRRLDGDVPPEVVCWWDRIRWTRRGGEPLPCDHGIAEYQPQWFPSERGVRVLERRSPRAEFGWSGMARLLAGRGPATAAKLAEYERAFALRNRSRKPQDLVTLGVVDGLSGAG